MRRRGYEINYVNKNKEIKKRKEKMIKDNLNYKFKGFIKIKDDLGNILLEKENAIHFENMSIALARALSGDPRGHIHEMHFGNGGSNLTGNGTLTYLLPNITGIDADLYSTTYYKVVNQNSNLNTDPSKNNITVKHVIGELYSDIIIKCVLDFNEPSGQEAFDNSINMEGDFIFDEIGLKLFNTVPGTGELITHVIFSPIQKSLNRQIEIEYIVRIQNC